MTEPAAAHGVHDVVAEHESEARAARRNAITRAVTAGVAVLVLASMASCGFIAARTRARSHDRSLWVTAISTRAELDCCAGARAGCADAERALVELSARLHAREGGVGDRISHAIGSVIGTNDVDLGSAMDMAQVDEMLAECRARAEVESIRSQLHQRAEERR